MAEFQQGMMGCFGNCGVCIITWFAPCVTVGRIGEAIGESFWYHCIMSLIPMANLYIMFTQRGTLREKRGIEGSVVSDLIAIWCCTGCALCQEGNEVQAMQGGMAVEAKECQMQRA